jgi:hypothetical protein
MCAFEGCCKEVVWWGSREGELLLLVVVGAMGLGSVFARALALCGILLPLGVGIGTALPLPLPPALARGVGSDRERDIRLELVATVSSCPCADPPECPCAEPPEPEDDCAPLAPDGSDDADEDGVGVPVVGMAGASSRGNGMRSRLRDAAKRCSVPFHNDNGMQKKRKMMRGFVKNERGAQEQ